MDKKSIVGIGVCVILLLLWFPLMRRVGWMPSGPAIPPAPTTEAQPVVPPPAPGERPAAQPATQPAEAEPVAPAGTPVAPAAPPQEMVSDEVSIQLDLQSGGITGITLHRYKTSDRKAPMSLGSVEAPFTAVRTTDPAATLGPPRLVAAEKTRVIVERDLLPAGVVLRQEWRLLPASPYQIAYKLTFRNPGADTVHVESLALQAGSLGLTPAEAAGGMGMAPILAIDLAFKDGTRPTSYAEKKIRKMSPEERKTLAAHEFRWAAVHTPYFVFYTAAGKGIFAGAELGGAEDPNGAKRVSGNLLLPALTLGPNGEASSEFLCYAGPKEYNRLHAVGGGLESILQMDLFFFFHPAWMGAVSKIVLKSLLWMQGFVHHAWGYGVAIIAITVLVKLLFWPLTHYSTISMKKLQVVQPQITAIREKYKGDPGKMQQKIMELYKENKVNPLGGCVPVVLQIPVFFALFNVFRNAIELRQANFLWVQDLSQPDTLSWMPFGLPIRPLALLTAGTMFVQQKITPTSMDPQQAKIMMFMTLFFAFLFYGMPAGLTLYWTVNQALGIVQTLITYRYIKLKTPAVAVVRP